MTDNNLLEKVFLKKEGWSVTNKSITNIEKSGWHSKFDVTSVWAAKDIESVKEVVSEGFSNRRGLVVLSLILTLIIMNTALGRGFVGWEIGELNFFGMSDNYSRGFILLSIIGAWTTLYQLMIKKGRYLSVKLKNGEEIVTYTPITSLIAVENAWNQASAAGFDGGEYDITLSDRGVEVTKETFSVKSSEEPKYLSEPFSSAYAPEWKTFNISDVINIAETKMRKDLFNEYTVVAALAVGFLTAMFFGVFGESGKAAIGFFAVLMVVMFVPLKRFIELDEKEITLELKDGESIKINGRYGWNGISRVKSAINESMTMAG
jgi:hypothetical protein